MAKRFSLKELAELTESSLVGDPTFEIEGIDTLESASPNDASFLANPRYTEAMKASDAGVICIDSQTEQTPRNISEKDLVDFANEVMDRKGILFIPSFSVERSQEIACVLNNANFKHKVIMDGMALSSYCRWMLWTIWLMYCRENSR